MGILKRIQQATYFPTTTTSDTKCEEFEYEGDVYYDCHEAQLHEHAHPLGGLGCHDAKLRTEQQQAIGEWIASMGKRLLSGNSLASTPAPVIIFEPRSFLQKLTDPWVYTQFLLAAARTPDKVARCKFVLAWFVAGQRHVFDTWRKPFNPVLGETWQGRSAVGGCSVFMEQVSHHPPVAAFTLEGRGFRVCGTTESNIQVTMKHRGFKQMVKGVQTITFDDGDVIDFLEFPAYVTKGVISSSDLRGDVSGQAVLHLRSAHCHLGIFLSFGPIHGSTDDLYNRTDAFNGYIATMSTHHMQSAAPSNMSCLGDESGSLTCENKSGRGLSAEWWGTTPRTGTLSSRGPGHTHELETKSSGGYLGSLRSNANSVRSVTAVSSWLRSTQGAAEDDMAPRDRLATFRGNFLSHLDFSVGGAPAERVWTLSMAQADEFESVGQEQRLPSDCTHREDMRLLARGDIKGAEAAKQAIEDRQRRDRKARQKAGK